MARIYGYKEFLATRRQVAIPTVAGRIPDGVMAKVLIPSVLVVETAWLAVLSYLGFSYLGSLLVKVLSY
jgi:hypothetical protein